MSLSDFKINFITSVDGAKIGFRQIGTGPGLILLHGGLQSSLNFTELAKRLATDFTVYVPDRRGRGLSSPYKDADNLLTEANDLLVLARHTKAPNIFALSAGAIVTLQASLIEPVFKRIALFEPPIPVGENRFVKLNTSYKSAMRSGNLGKAFIAILKGTGDPGISLLNTLPGFITAPFVSMLMKLQLKSRNENELPLQELVKTFHHDLILIKESAALLDEVRNIQADVLLLGGAKSQKYFKPVLNRLQASIKNTKRFEFAKLGHVAADNNENPLKVASELIPFFKQTNTID